MSHTCHIHPGIGCSACIERRKPGSKRDLVVLMTITLLIVLLVMPWVDRGVSAAEAGYRRYYNWVVGR